MLRVGLYRKTPSMFLIVSHGGTIFCQTGTTSKRLYNIRDLILPNLKRILKKTAQLNLDC
jgi:hypothetical protein